MAIVKLFAALTGKSMSSMVDNGKALKQQTDTYKALSSGGSKAAKGMKKTTDEAKKQLAAFDELNILTEDKAKEDSGADFGGGVSGGPTGATFDGLKEIDTTQLDALSEKLQGIAAVSYTHLVLPYLAQLWFALSVFRTKSTQIKLRRIQILESLESFALCFPL